MQAHDGWFEFAADGAERDYLERLIESFPIDIVLDSPGPVRVSFVDGVVTVEPERGTISRYVERSRVPYEMQDDRLVAVYDGVFYRIT